MGVRAPFEEDYISFDFGSHLCCHVYHGTLLCYQEVRAGWQFVSLTAAGKYNQIRCVNQSQIKVPKTNENMLQQRYGKTKIQRTLSKTASSLRRLHTFHPIDILKNSMNVKQVQKAPRSMSKHLSLPMSMEYQYDFRDDSTIIDAELIREQMQKFNKKNRQYLRIILNQSAERVNQRLDRCRVILGNIIKKQLNRQIDNMEELRDKIQDLFNIEVIDYNQSINPNAFRPEGIDRRTQLNPRIQLNKSNYQVFIDQIFENERKGLLSKCGYPISPQIKNNYAIKGQKFSSLSSTFKERKRLDGIINYNSQFPTHESRMNTIRILKQIGKNYLQNKPLFIQNENNPTQEIEVKQFVIWVVSKNINELVKGKVNQAAIYLAQQPINNTQSQKMYIRWLEDDTKLFPLYNQVVKTQSTQKTYQSLAGLQNIECLLLYYFYTLLNNREVRLQLNKVPELQNYITDVFYR